MFVSLFCGGVDTHKFFYLTPGDMGTVIQSFNQRWSRCPGVVAPTHRETDRHR